MLKYSPPSRETSCILSGGSSRWEGRKNHSTLFNVKEKIGSERSSMKLQVQEEEGMVGFGDFRGFHSNNPDSKYRELISRIKKGYVSDPTMRGKLLNQPGGKWSKFCCETGCSTNLMPAKMAAMGGLRWSPLDPDEPQYRSVTNEKLEIVGQTSCFVKLEKVKTPVKLSFLVCMDDGNEALLCLNLST